MRYGDLSHAGKYTTYSSENSQYIKVGALLATGLLNSGVRTETDAALALLGECTTNPSLPLKVVRWLWVGVRRVALSA